MTRYQVLLRFIAFYCVFLLQRTRERERERGKEGDDCDTSEKKFRAIEKKLGTIQGVCGARECVF